MWTTFSQLFGKSITRRTVDTRTWGRRPTDSCDESVCLQDRLSNQDQHPGPRVEEFTAFEALTVPYYDGS